MKIDHIGFIPLTAIPVPYKYLIGVGFYFYIKSLVEKKEKVIRLQEYLLFLPAIFYGFLRLYWYIKLHSGLDKDIFWNVYQTGFFVYNDFAYLIFNLIITGFAVRFLLKNKNRINSSISNTKNWKWLTRFTYVFIGFVLLNLLHQILALSLNLEHSGEFYAAILVLNSMYIYWIGFVGFTKSNVLFRTFDFHDKNEQPRGKHSIKSALEHYIFIEEVFTNQHLKIADLASQLDITDRELSIYIYETFNSSFVDYINEHRIERVKKLLLSSEHKKYTLVAIAEKSGFSSKSTFNAVFKKITGETPSEFKKKHKK